MCFLELWQAPGVYSRVTARMPIVKGVCSVKSGHLSWYDGHLGKLNYAWQDIMDDTGGEVGGQASLIS